MPRRMPTWYWPMLLAIVILSVCMQSLSLLRSDVSWLLRVAERFLAGGTYTTDYYETNPPMSFYLYLPAVGLAKYTACSLVLAVRIYVYSMAFLSWGVCDYLLKRIMERGATVAIALLNVSILVLYLLAPGFDFGQREHIAMMLIFPYLLLTALRWMQYSVNRGLSWAIGLCAGIGFAVKPHLLITVLLVESAGLLRLKRGSYLFRPETIAMAGVWLCYLLAIYHYHTDYRWIIPEVYAFIGVFLANKTANPLAALADLLDRYKVLFALVVLGIYTIERRSLRQIPLAVVMMLSLVGFLLYFIAEPIFLDYHALPLMYAACFLSVIMLVTHFQAMEQSPRWLKWTASSLLFVAPVYSIATSNMLMFAERRDPTTQQLIQFVRSSPPSTFYFFATRCSYQAHLQDESSWQTASRYECLWPLFSIISMGYHKDLNAMSQREAARIKLTESVLDDMTRHPPQWVFIDPIVGWGIYENVRFDYVKFFTQSERFRDFWQHYQYVGNIQDVAIYKRLSPSNGIASRA